MKKRATRKPPRRQKWITWLLAASIIGLVGFALSQMSGIAYTERDIRVVDFSSLTARQKRTALEAANAARCHCGCGMGLAQCVATDSTCPIRDSNIDTIKSMVRDAAR
jgi:hypothetical protein